MSNKKLEEISSEDLLNALQSDEQLEIKNTPPVLEFIERFDLKSGDQPVESRLLFALFLKYYPQIMTRHQFTEQANKLLKYERGGFYLNKDNKLLYHELCKNHVKKQTRASIVSTSSASLQKHFKAFFDSIELVPGKQRVPWFVLYHLYRAWCIDNNRKKPRAPKVFNKYMQVCFEYFINSNGPVYLINTVVNLPNKGEYHKIEQIYEKEESKRRLHLSRAREKRKS